MSPHAAEAVAMDTTAEVTGVPKSVPSLGRMENVQRWPLAVVPAGTVVAPASAVCSTPSLNQRISLPLWASLSESA